ncbi:MAG: metal-dependent hydrolase [Chloroflexi bacterium]|nr:metal-dependent hydrolase [Chloroflexota bacterium]
MLFFGHIGFTVGVARACEILAANNNYAPDSSSRRARLSHWLKGAWNHLNAIDYRLVALGSLLPDIIDKPLWLLFGNDISLSGRDYAHTLLFNLLLLAAGLVLVQRRKPWLLVLSFSSFMHLVFDELWQVPATLFWPLLGPLAAEERTHWFSNLIAALFSEPEVYIPESIGLLLLLVIGCQILARRRLVSFLKKGAIPQ